MNATIQTKNNATLEVPVQNIQSQFGPGCLCLQVETSPIGNLVDILEWKPDDPDPVLKYTVQFIISSSSVLFVWARNLWCSLNQLDLFRVEWERINLLVQPGVGICFDLWKMVIYMVCIDWGYEVNNSEAFWERSERAIDLCLRGRDLCVWDLLSKPDIWKTSLMFSYYIELYCWTGLILPFAGHLWFNKSGNYGLNLIQRAPPLLILILCLSFSLEIFSSV